MHGVTPYCGGDVGFPIQSDHSDAQSAQGRHDLVRGSCAYLAKVFIGSNVPYPMRWVLNAPTSTARGEAPFGTSGTLVTALNTSRRVSASGGLRRTMGVFCCLDKPCFSARATADTSEARRKSGLEATALDAVNGH